MEICREIDSYDNYSVSNFVNVRNDKTGKLLRSEINIHGYYYVNLHKDGKIKQSDVHRLVTEAFVNNIDDKNVSITLIIIDLITI